MRHSVLAMWTAAVLATGAAFVTYLAVRFENVRMGYALDKATHEQKRLSEMLRMLSLEAQTLREHDRVQAIAHQTLGMKKPEAERIVSVDGAGARPTGRLR